MWRNDCEPYYRHDNYIPLDMTVEDCDLVIDKEEILSISKCTQLTDVHELKIPGKNFTVINAIDLSQCINLRELDLSENCLTYFPRNLNLPVLKVLDLTGNSFTEKPLLEQFPSLIILNVDQQTELNMDKKGLAYFCPNLKFLNGEVFEEKVSDQFFNAISNASRTLEPIIRMKWESEFADKCMNLFNNVERRMWINEMVQQLKDRNLLISDNLNKYRDLLIYKLTEEYLKTKCIDTEDELLAGDTSPLKKSCDFYAINNEDDKKFLMRYVDVYENEMRGLSELTDDLMGNNVSNVTNHIVIATDLDGQPQQFLVEQPSNAFHIGQSLMQNRSVVMTIFNPKQVKGRPTAEFLPGELRNKDYVKGDMASDIYQKTVKEALGQRGLSKSNPLSSHHISNNVGSKKRGRPPKITGELPKIDPIETPLPASKVPPRPKFRKRNGELSSLKDLDYDPLHFIRCHAKDSTPHDQETKVWRCAFEPDPNVPGMTTHCVATCGGECVCIIDCEAGKVKKRFKREHEEFIALAWTTLGDESGRRINILAAGGKSKEIRLFFTEGDSYLDMKGHQEDVSSLAFNTTFPQILFSGDAKASVIVWDIGSPTNQLKLMRYQLLMRLRCPRLDLNPVMNLVYLDHYSYLIAGCDDAIFAWKITEYRNEKREREPDIELKFTEALKIDVPIESISYDGLAQLGRTALVFRIVNSPCLFVFDFGTTLERRKGLQKIVPIEVCGRLESLKTDDFYINICGRNNLGAVLCGDSNGSIWIYDLDPYIEENPERVSKGFTCSPIKVLEWPDCSMNGNSEDETSNMKNPVVNTVDMSSDGLFVVGVTDNNLVCIWRLSKD